MAAAAQMLEAVILLLLWNEQATAYSNSSDNDGGDAPFSGGDSGAHLDIVVDDHNVSKSMLGRTLLQPVSSGGGTLASICRTGNPIDDCWLCDVDWRANRKRLADCAVGFGRNAVGGRDGQEYVVNDPSDDRPSDPKPGTLRHAAMQMQPLWIIFAGDMEIILSEDIIIGSFKTIDGRGAQVRITGAGCFYLETVNNVIIHSIHIHDCVKLKQDGDAITVRGSRDVWIDHCTLWSCHDGLIDISKSSTAITISNNHFHHHLKVMMLGHSDNFEEDVGMQVTVAFNVFGEGLAEWMPRCQFGNFHVVNNDYVGWTMYAVGGSSNPTINSQGNRFAAGADQKEVTKRMETDESEWRRWNWRSQGDLLLNGAFFTASGDPNEAFYEKATSFNALPADRVAYITQNAGALGSSTGVGGGNGDIIGRPFPGGFPPALTSPPPPPPKGGQMGGQTAPRNSGWGAFGYYYVVSCGTCLHTRSWRWVLFSVFLLAFVEILLAVTL